MDERVIKGEKARAILEEAHKRFKLCVDAEAKNREDALDDLEFLTGKQWTDKALKARADRPCLTINRLPQYVRQVTNEQRKTRPAIDVIPADAKASKPTADVLQGLVRYIERSSRARVAYDQAFQYAVACGVGHFRVATEYVDDTGFDQDIVIKPIDNPFSVYRDPSSTEPDHADDNYTFVTEFVECEDFKDRYGFEPTKFEDAGTGDDVPQWFSGEDVMVAEYWRVLIEDGELIALSDGTTQTTPLSAEQKKTVEVGTIQVVAQRPMQKRIVEQYLLTYDKVIKKSEWAGKYIPILTSTGERYVVGGETRVFSLIRFAKDPARMYNYQASAEVELIALQPKAPWVATEDQLDGHQNAFTRANIDNAAYLTYNHVDGVPPPMRQPFAGVPMGVREARMAAAEDIKSTLGMYDASLGARSNETSGVAIKARQQEGDTGTFHFIDNHARAIEQCGRVIIDLIPHVYDTPRTIRIVSPTDDEHLAVINQMFIDPKTGTEGIHDLQVGRYDVAVRVGPSFESKRQEMVQAMVELSSANPRILEVAADLILKNMDFPQAEEISQRLYMTLPPQFRGEQAAPDPAQQLVQAQIQGEQIKAQATQTKAQADVQIKGAEVSLAQQEMQLKQMELAADREKAVMDAQLQREQIALEREKLALEYQKLRVEATATAVEAVMPHPMMDMQ